MKIGGKLKILMVTEWHPLTIGGVQRHVKELAENLIEKGFEVTIITKTNNKKLNKKHGKIPIIEIEHATPIQSILTPPSPNKLKEAIMKYSPDIIHVHHAFTPTPLLTLYIADKMEKPKILTNHSIAGNSILTLMSCKGLKFLKYFISRADKIISVSKCAAKFIEKLLGSEVESIIIPNGVNVNRFKPSEKEADKPIVLFVGRLVHRKGVHILIKAFTKVVKEIPEAKLVIVGEGYMKPILQMISKQLKIKEKVKFLGEIDEEKLLKTYQKSRVVVIPSLYRESFGIVALEAMATGKPVIATRVGGLPEIIKDGINGLLTQPGNPTELAEKITLLLSDKSIANKMGVMGRKIAVEKYSWNVIAKQIINVYLEVIEEKSGYLNEICGDNFEKTCQTSI